MESFADEFAEVHRRPLQSAHVDALRIEGVQRTYDAGEIVAEAGSPMEELVYVEEGEIEIIRSSSRTRVVELTVGPAQFMGEIGLLTRERYPFSARACRPTRAIVVPRECLLRLLTRIPEMNEIVLTVLAARRRDFVGPAGITLTLTGADVDPTVRKVAQFASESPHA